MSVWNFLMDLPLTNLFTLPSSRFSASWYPPLWFLHIYSKEYRVLAPVIEIWLKNFSVWHCVAEGYGWNKYPPAGRHTQCHPKQVEKREGFLAHFPYNYSQVTNKLYNFYFLLIKKALYRTSYVLFNSFTVTMQFSFYIYFWIIFQQFHCFTLF